VSSGLWYRTLVYLGLKEEPEEGYDDLPERMGRGEDAGEAAYRRFDATGDLEVDSGRRSDVGDVEWSLQDDERENVRPLRVADAGDNVRPLASAVRLAVVEVGRFEDVEEVGSRYRTGQPVLFDVAGADSPTARRVVDFVAGLTYALRGRMTKVGARAFLLVPDGVQLPPDELRRLDALGYRLPAGSET
jgi:cell division inhibitor SepF